MTILRDSTHRCEFCGKDSRPDVTYLVSAVDELLAATVGHQLITVSEVTDGLLDLRMKILRDTS